MRKLFFAENWEDPYDFEPEVYVDVTETFDPWREAAGQYELFRGGISDFRFRDYYEALATMRGCLSGFRYACAFMRPRGARKQRLQFLP